MRWSVPIRPTWRGWWRLTGSISFTTVWKIASCAARCAKFVPLERKLAGLQAWATGLRREQTEDRAATPKVQEVDGRVKINPLADWTAAQVDQYIAERGVILHPLYARGFGSIGCAPCTRALEPGESERAGRWWWEQDDRKECGIHISAAGVVRRA